MVINILVSQTKLDSSLTVWQIMVKRCNTTFKLDRNQTVVGLLFDVHHDLLCTLLVEFTSEKAVENIFVKIKIEEMAPFIVITTQTNLITNHLHCISMGIGFYSSKMLTLLFLVISTQISNTLLEQYCGLCNLKPTKRICIF